MKREMADTPDDVETQEIVRGMERTVCALGVVLSAYGGMYNNPKDEPGLREAIYRLSAELCTAASRLKELPVTITEIEL